MSGLSEELRLEVAENRIISYENVLQSILSCRPQLDETNLDKKKVHVATWPVGFMGNRHSRRGSQHSMRDSSRSVPSGTSHQSVSARGSTSRQHNSSQFSVRGSSHGASSSTSSKKSSSQTVKPSLLSTVVSETASSTSGRSKTSRIVGCSPRADASTSESEMNALQVPNKFIRLPKELWEDSALPLQDVNPNPNVVLPVGFRDSERILLLTLWHEIASHTRNLAVKFYVSLITLYPEFRERFGNDRVAADAHIQSHTMAALRYLINLANYIDDEEAFNESINNLAATHKNLNLSKEDLLVINTVFINMLIKELPSFMFPESAYALIMYLATVTKRMFLHMHELKIGKKNKENEARPSMSLKRKFSSTSEELYESITEWHIEVIHLHNKRLAMSNTSLTSSSMSRRVTTLLAPCLPSDPNRSRTSTKGKKK